MVRYIRSATYQWSTGESITTDLPKSEFVERYTNLKKLSIVLQGYSKKYTSVVFNQLVSKVDTVLTADNFTGDIAFSNEEKLLLYLLSQFSAPNTKAAIKKMCKYAPRIKHIGEDQYDYLGWHIFKVYNDNDEDLGVWGLIDPSGNWDVSDTSIARAKRTVEYEVLEDLAL